MSKDEAKRGREHQLRTGAEVGGVSLVLAVWFALVAAAPVWGSVWLGDTRLMGGPVLTHRPASAGHPKTWRLDSADSLRGLPGRSDPEYLRARWLVAPNAAPELTIPLGIRTIPGGDGEVPVLLGTNGNSISSVIFSINYDQEWLTFDPFDWDRDGIPEAIDLRVPPQFSAVVRFDESDTDGEIDVFIADLAPPLAALPEGALMVVELQAGSPGMTTEADVRFSLAPAPSFGDDQGESVEGLWLGGSVIIEVPTTATATARFSPTVTASASATQHRTPAATSTRGPVPTGTPPGALTATATRAATATSNISPTASTTSEVTPAGTPSSESTPRLTRTHTPGPTPTATASATRDPFGATPSATATRSEPARTPVPTMASETPTITVTGAPTATTSATGRATNAPAESPAPTKPIQDTLYCPYVVRLSGP